MKNSSRFWRKLVNQELSKNIFKKYYLLQYYFKCFEGIDNLTFQEDLLITDMSSNMKEKIKLLTNVNPLANDGSVRGVEEWLFDV
jgi:hypothetical protein